MTSLLNSLVVVVLLLNILALGTSRIRAVIRTVSLQGVLLGLMPLLVHEHLTPLAVLIAVATVALKGIVIPGVLFRALRDAQIKREVEPLIGLLPSMMLGALATALAIIFATHLPLAGDHGSTLLVPGGLATLLVGFIVLTTRIKAISQTLGYLILENGIFLFGLVLIEAMPFLVEVGVLLDLFVGIFVISIIMHHINREFASLDTRRLSALKD